MNVGILVRMHLCVCMYICTNACVYPLMGACLYVRKYGGRHVCVHACMFACAYVCMCLCADPHARLRARVARVRVSFGARVRLCVCV